MKNLFIKIFAAVALLALPLASQGAAVGLTAPINGFSASTTNGGSSSTLSWAIVSARSGNGGAPAVTYINAGSSSNLAKIYFYKVNAQTAVTYTNSTVTLFVNSTNGFSMTGTIIVRHLADDTYEKRTLTASGQSASTNMVVTAATLGTVVPGDIVYQVTSDKSINWGASTNTINASFPVYYGQQGYPLLAEIDSLSTANGANLFMISGYYLPPVTVPRPGL